MKKRMFLWMALWLLAAFVLVSCSGGGGGGGGSQCVDISGTWSITETSGANTCGDTVGVSALNVYTIVQNGGCSFIATDGTRTFNGSVSGTHVTWTGSYADSGGTVTVTGTSINVSSDGNSMSGTGNWIWSNGTPSYDCSGVTSSMTGTRGPVPGGTGPATFDASGSWVGNWNSTTTGHSGVNGTFSAIISQLGSSLTGTVSVYSASSTSITLSNEQLQGSVHGSTITFGDINHIITFTGTMSNYSASGTYTCPSLGDSGTWSGGWMTSPPPPTAPFSQ